MSDNETTTDENEYDATQEYLKEYDPGCYDVTEDLEIDQDDSYHIAYEAKSLGIRQEDLAEIGGFSIQFART